MSIVSPTSHALPILQFQHQPVWKTLPKLTSRSQQHKCLTPLLKHSCVKNNKLLGQVTPARQKLKTSPTPSLREKFRTLRSKVKAMVAESRAEFYISLPTDLRLNPKIFWSLFKLTDKTASAHDSR